MRDTTIEPVLEFVVFVSSCLALAIVLGAASQSLVSANLWLPESIGPRTGPIDSLFDRIHIILGVFLVITGLTLAWTLWRFPADRKGVASFRRNNIPLELLWTVVPGAILIWLAMNQLPVWNENKVDPPIHYIVDATGESVALPPLARVVARQFEWTFIYPGDDGEFETQDDIISDGVFVVPEKEQFIVELTSEDVIHGFAINPLRLKQDIVPELDLKIWFSVDRTGSWEINCAELCGWGHYRMMGELRVVSSDEFENWKTARFEAQCR